MHAAEQVCRETNRTVQIDKQGVDVPIITHREKIHKVALHLTKNYQVLKRLVD